MKAKALVALIFVLAVWVRLYRLTGLPGEWYGDISNVHEYVSEILSGKWPFYFLQSPGPFYHYLIIPIVLIFRNLGYETYKYSSVIVSILGLYGIYLLALEISGKKTALITLLLSSFSLWYLVFSRLGNSQIVIPGYIAFSAYFMFRFMRNGNLFELIRTILITSLGWYIYPQTFIFPPLLFGYLLVFIFRNTEKKYPGKIFTTFAFTAILGILPLMFIIKNQDKNYAGNFSSDGYLGAKIIPVFSMPYKELSEKLGNNISLTYLMLHKAGDPTFRVNISGNPQLDRISGYFFILGLIYSLIKLKPKYSIFMVLCLLLLPIPSISPAISPSEIPNSARTIALIPFVYLLIALGVRQTFYVLRKINGSFAVYVLVLAISYIGYLNLSDYFRAYAAGLPDKNLGPSKIISHFIDENYPEEYKLYFAECCWGNYGEPEPKGIGYELRENRPMNINHTINRCEDIDKPAIIVYKNKNKLNKNLRMCFAPGKEKIIYQNKKVIGRIVKL